ncbi:Protein outspread, partial [Anthophora retusa]
MSGGTAGVRGTGAECRKFAPNIFNKSKCSSCFKQKEEHSAEALECNRATRRISKCGYLFVAPGWDFSNPLNRTKVSERARWQRRWFVLYDDGELTYSVDEHVSFFICNIPFNENTLFEYTRCTRAIESS